MDKENLVETIFKPFQMLRVGDAHCKHALNVMFVEVQRWRLSCCPPFFVSPCWCPCRRAAGTTQSKKERMAESHSVDSTTWAWATSRSVIACPCSKPNSCAVFLNTATVLVLSIMLKFRRGSLLGIHPNVWFSDLTVRHLDVEQPGSSKIWGFLMGMFWVSFVTYYVLWRSYRRIISLRVRRQASAKARPEDFTVLVRDIPKPPPHQTHAEHVDAFFRSVHPGSYDRCIIVKDLRKVSLLVWVWFGLK